SSHPTQPMVNSGAGDPSVAAALPAEPKLETPIESRFADISIRGTYGQVMHFFDELYQLQRIVNVRTWSITPFAQPSLEGEQQYVVNFAVTIYTAPKYASSV